MEKTNRTFGLRPGHATEIVNQMKAYLETHPANYYYQMDLSRSTQTVIPERRTD